MAEVGLQEVETYVSRRQNMVAKFIATRTIIYLCLAAEQRLGPMISMWWWEQDGLDMEGIRTTAREAEQTEGEEDTDEKETETD